MLTLAELRKIKKAVASIQPIDGIGLGLDGVVKIHFRSGVTTQQRAAAEDIVKNWTPTPEEQPLTMDDIRWIKAQKARIGT